MVFLSTRHIMSVYHSLTNTDSETYPVSLLGGARVKQKVTEQNPGVVLWYFACQVSLFSKQWQRHIVLLLQKEKTWASSVIGFQFEHVWLNYLYVTICHRVAYSSYQNRKQAQVCAFDEQSRWQVRRSSRRVPEGWVEIEVETIYLFIDLYILNKGRGVELHLSLFKEWHFSFMEKTSTYVILMKRDLGV